jgi:hypothetical protein
MSQTIPENAKKYFWGDNLQDLSLQKHKKYIIQTLLEKGNIESIQWLFNVVTREEVKAMLPNLRLSKKSSNFWKIYL